MPRPKKKGNRTITMKCKCELTDRERDKFTKELTMTLQRRYELVAERKSMVADYKAKIDEADEKILAYTGALNTGFEMRDTRCEVYFNVPKDGKKTIARMDTGDEIGVFPMTDEEKQEEIDFELPEGDKGDDGDE